ncbi:MAG: N-acetylmuramoyl-L-alanine amidase [Proteobacteria bacterium]|nr:N-acetylmuramoyl-L-alanine amidase [Pseudomonadota bacterium]
MRTQYQLSFLPVRARLIAAILLYLLLSSAPVFAASVAQEFNSAYDHFHALRSDSKKGSYRAEWEKVQREFAQVLKHDPDGSYTPKAFYYHARVYEEIGNRSGWKTDFEKSVDYFGRVVSRFPGHAWADDCLYRSAMIRLKRLNQPEEAYLELATIVRDYPQADMFAKAKEELAKVDQEEIESIQAKNDPAQQAMADETQEAPTEPQPSPVADPDNVANLDMVRYLSSDDYTRVVFDLNGAVDYYYKLLNPLPDKGKGYRVYIDLKNTRIGNAVVRDKVISDGILRGYRAAQYDHTTTRVVLDLHEYQEHKVFHLDNPFRLVVDVYAPGNGHAPSQAQTPSKPGSFPRDVDPGDLVEVLGLKVKTVMIDPGHGGNDPGARHNGIKEKDTNLKVGMMLGKLLAEKGFKVVYTRTTDVFVPLEDRAAMANMSKADLFISLHCNANKKTSIRGLETYSLSLKSSSEAAKRVAARENGVQPSQISDSQLILTELMLNSKMEESSDLAAMIQKQVVKQMPSKYGIQDHGRRRAPFYVLMGAKMPAVLVELGYTTNKTESKYLQSDAYLKYLAGGIASGVDAYRKHIERYVLN